jgi:hypothetical protein
MVSEPANWYRVSEYLHEMRGGIIVPTLTYRQGLHSPAEREHGWQLAEVSGDANPYGFQRLLFAGTLERASQERSVQWCWMSWRGLERRWR